MANAHQHGGHLPGNAARRARVGNLGKGGRQLVAKGVKG
jgi:hypothetical protein